MWRGPTLVVSQQADWEDFRKENLDLIVDPMVYRSADVYLRGQKKAVDDLPEKDAGRIWKSLSSNIGSLTAFFDALVLSARLPIIDYGVTYDSAIKGLGLHEPPWLCRAVNEALDDDVLVDVHIEGEVSQAARAAAKGGMKLRPRVGAELEASIRDELSTFDYQWKPDLGELGALPEEQLAVPRFLYGGLVFTAFAQMSGAGHLLQPKRNQMFQSLALAVPHDDERELLAELDRRIKAAPELKAFNAEFVTWPTFLPYLLSKDPKAPADLLREVSELRKTQMVRDYQYLRGEMIRNWAERGIIDPGHERDVKRTVLALHEEMKVVDRVPVEAGVDFKVDVTGVGVTPKLSVNAPAGAIWGWALGNLPGRGYLKLMLRLSLAAHSYARYDRHLNTLWSKN